MAESGGCNKTVDDGHAATGFFGLSLEGGPRFHFFLTERQDAAGKCGK